MSNLTSKITDTYFPKDEQHFFKLFLRFLLVTFGGAAFIQSPEAFPSSISANSPTSSVPSYTPPPFSPAF